jgi:hypothetical protein
LKVATEEDEREKEEKEEEEERRWPFVTEPESQKNMWEYPINSAVKDR